MAVAMVPSPQMTRKIFFKVFIIIIIIIFLLVSSQIYFFGLGSPPRSKVSSNPVNILL
jgi:tetrahydromethanopterin S-methyltransferase subunit D